MKKQNQPYRTPDTAGISRRQFVTGLASTSVMLGLGGKVSGALAGAPNPSGIETLRGQQFDLEIGHLPVNFTGNRRIATAINGSIPGPTLRWREGDRVRLRVRNRLAHDTSIHWHGMILPTGMDGVPGLSFDGIKPGSSFEYQFDVNQNGTYWYHSHSGFQEQTGVYGAIVIEPREPDLVTSDREHVILLSDWSDESPEHIYATLKKLSHYYNDRERTVGDLWRDVREKGVHQTWNERSMWNRMRMSDSDLSDVTGYTYTYLMNGVAPAQGWTAMFRPGERVRLRFINGSAMTLFDVRIPGLKMKVVAADGQNVDPVTVDEFRIGTAETYDVVVEPEADAAYTIFAQSMDRSGYARGTLTPNPAWNAEVPDMDRAVRLGHQDMGMGMDHSRHGGASPMTHSSGSMNGMDHRGHAQHTNHAHHGHHDHAAPGRAGHGSAEAVRHADTEYGPHVDMRAESPQSGLDDPGVGLRDHRHRYGRRVLTYADLRNLEHTRDHREPEREIQLHLTGNMARYMWSLDGIRFADAEPLMLKYGERVRITLVNDTMMTHPIHLHGLWSELETGDPMAIPRKHTILVQPGSKISYLVTADAMGRWAYHCHLLYHMPGMMREVRVV